MPGLLAASRCGRAAAQRSVRRRTAPPLISRAPLFATSRAVGCQDCPDTLMNGNLFSGDRMLEGNGTPRN